MTRRLVVTALLACAVAIGGASHAAAQPRPFELGFTPLPPVYSTFGQNVVYGYLQQHGDLVSHTLQYGVPWPQAYASSDYHTYPAGLRSTWEALAATDATFIPGHARYISIQPINYAYDGIAEYWGDRTLMPLPAPWNARGFDDPAVRQAFLNYAIAAVEFFHPKYLGIAVEANILLARSPTTWNSYLSLNAYVYTGLKRRYPDLVVFASVQYEHMLGLQYESKHLLEQVGSWWPTVLEDEVAELLKSSDLLVLSTYPYMTDGFALTPAYYDPALAVAQQGGRHVAIEQTGYTSQSVQIYYTLLVGDEARQAQFVSTMLQLATEHEFAFVVNFIAIDYAYNYGTDPISLTWAFTGLWRPDGSAKPAADVWGAYLQRPLASAAP